MQKKLTISNFKHYLLHPLWNLILIPLLGIQAGILLALRTAPFQFKPSITLFFFLFLLIIQETLFNHIHRFNALQRSLLLAISNAILIIFMVLISLHSTAKIGILLSISILANHFILLKDMIEVDIQIYRLLSQSISKYLLPNIVMYYLLTESLTKNIIYILLILSILDISTYIQQKNSGSKVQKITYLLILLLAFISMFSTMKHTIYTFILFSILLGLYIFTYFAQKKLSGKEFLLALQWNELISNTLAICFLFL